MVACTATHRDLGLLLIVAVLVSMGLSAWLNCREVVINPDAICYLLSAEKMGTGGLSAAMNLCGQAKWPFYSLLIYGLVRVANFSYPVAAYLLDGFFSVLSVFFFILIVKQLGASKRVLWLAAAVILLSHQFNSVREYIIRDHGFWAFYLSSLWLLLHYFTKPTWHIALFFNASLILATLFRIEGVIFLLSLPYLAWFHRQYAFKQRAKQFFALNALTCFALSVLGFLLILHPQETSSKLGRLPEVLAQGQKGFVLMMSQFQATKSSLAQHVLNTDSANQAGLVLGVVLFVWYFLSIVGNLSWPYTFLVIFGALTKAYRFSSAAMLVLTGYLLVNFFITFGFLLERLFLSKRYLIAFSLVLMLFVPFALDKIVSNASRRVVRLLCVALMFCIFASSIGGIINFGYSKAYIRDAGNWIDKNVSKEATLYANDYQLMYYSKHFGEDIFKKLRQFVPISLIESNAFKHYDYLALRLSQKEEKNILQAIAPGIEGQIVQTFRNQRGDQVIIYQVKKAE